MKYLTIINTKISKYNFMSFIWSFIPVNPPLHMDDSNIYSYNTESVSSTTYLDLPHTIGLFLDILFGTWCIY